MSEFTTVFATGIACYVAGLWVGTLIGERKFIRRWVEDWRQRRALKLGFKRHQTGTPQTFHLGSPQPVSISFVAELTPEGERLFKAMMSSAEQKSPKKEAWNLDDPDFWKQ